MGNIEHGVARRVRISKLQKTILGCIAVAGLLGVAAVAPNALRALSMFGIGKNRKRYFYSSARRSVSRLADAGLVSFENVHGKKFLRLTEKGRNRMALLEVHDFKLKKPKRWDGKWRMVIFDIKEGRKSLRHTLRETLRAVGFTKLQNSVWVYPYDCEDLITLLKVENEFGRSVLYVVADAIENDVALRKMYKLPLA